MIGAYGFVFMVMIVGRVHRNRESRPLHGATACSMEVVNGGISGASRIANGPCPRHVRELDPRHLSGKVDVSTRNRPERLTSKPCSSGERKGFGPFIPALKTGIQPRGRFTNPR